MSPHPGLRSVEQIAGGLLFLFILLDIFVTVLYARMSSGILSPRIARVTWIIFRAISAPLSHRRGRLLSFCGPSIVVLVVFIWAVGLTVGTAMIFHPQLGYSIRTASGATDRDFVTAMFAGGTSLSIVRASSFEPQTRVFRLLYLFNSLVGLSVLSLTLTYLMQIYSALNQRNTLGLNFYLASACKADAAEIIASSGARGKFETGYVDVAGLAGGLVGAKEAHHFYPVLFYFRFEEPYYSVSSFCFLALDTATLIRSALDDGDYGWLQESAAVATLWDGSVILLTSLESTFLRTGIPPTGLPDPDTRERWRVRYFAAIARIRRAGIKTVADPNRGADRYVLLRSQWDSYVTRLAPTMLYSLAEIDPVSARGPSGPIAA